MNKNTFKVKDMDISTGGILVAILNQKDAEKYDLHPEDRIKIFKGKRVETVVIDIAESGKAVPVGRIGLMEEVIDSLKVKNKDKVNIMLAGKPRSLEIIKKKLEGKEWTKEDIYQIVWDITHNKLDDIELTYFVSSCYTNALNEKETVLLTKAMAESGIMLNFGKKLVLDKHCIGGVAGNRTTMLIVPIIAAAGFTIPKTSSRSITSPAGTADTMEVLAKVDIPLSKIRDIIKKQKGCIIWGGSLNLAPADDKIIKVERPLRIDAESNLLASILAKKASVGANRVLVDIPIGKEAKIISMRRALNLKKKFVSIGRKLKMKIKVIFTNGNQPIGNGIGPALEARDVLWILRRDPLRPKDLEKKAVMMAGTLLQIAGVKNGKNKAMQILESGRAYKKMKDIIKAQGGNPKLDPANIKIGEYNHSLIADKNGKVKNIDNRSISRIARIAGAPADKGAGIYLYKHEGEKVKKGDELFTIYAESKEKLSFAIETLKRIDGFII